MATKISPLSWSKTMLKKSTLIFFKRKKSILWKTSKSEFCPELQNLSQCSSYFWRCSIFKDCVHSFNSIHNTLFLSHAVDGKTIWFRVHYQNYHRTTCINPTFPAFKIITNENYQFNYQIINPSPLMMSPLLRF